MAKNTKIALPNANRTSDMMIWMSIGVAIMGLVWIAWSTIQLSNKPKEQVVVRKYLYDWPDYGFKTWRRGGSPWGRNKRRSGSHKWHQSGGAKVGRPMPLEKTVKVDV